MATEKTTFEQITIIATASALTATVYNPGGAGEKYNYAIITTNGDPIRYRKDGPAPTASVGHRVASGSTIVLEDEIELQSFVAIRDSDATSNPTLDISYERRNKV